MNLNIRVQAYIQQWEQKVTQNLQASKTRLFMLRKPHKRACLKRDIETLTAVLDLLQGKTQQEHPTFRKQREEIAVLRYWLCATQIQLYQANKRLGVQQKITRDVKIQINVELKRQYDSQEKNQDLLLQLEDTKKICATKLSMASILNMDLRCKLNNTRKPLQQQTEEDFQEARDYMDVCDDMKDMQVEATEKRPLGTIWLDFSDDVALKEEEDKEGPELQMVKEAPEHDMVKEAPELQMAKEGPELQMVKEGPELRMVTEASELQMVTEAPEHDMVKEAPELQMVKEAPELQMVKEAPELQIVKEAPELLMIKEGPEVQMVKEAPELQMAKEDPELQMVNLFQENEKVMVHLTMSDLQQIIGSEVSRLWEEKENRLRSQEATIMQLWAGLKKTKRKPKAEKEKPVQKSPLQKKKPKKQNWFLRLFGCIFPKCVLNCVWWFDWKQHVLCSLYRQSAGCRLFYIRLILFYFLY